MYHYAGNNPVRYTDPDGRFDVNYEEKIIRANLESPNDMKRAEHFYKYNQNFSLSTSNRYGDGIIFSNYKEYKNIQKLINGKKVTSEDILSALANTTYIISEVGNSFDQYKIISKKIGNLSSLFLAILTLYDGVQVSINLHNAYEYGEDIDTDMLYDLIVDCAGFIPVLGSLVSVELDATRTFAEILGDMTYYMNLYLDDYFKQRIEKDYYYMELDY